MHIQDDGHEAPLCGRSTVKNLSAAQESEIAA